MSEGKGRIRWVVGMASVLGVLLTVGLAAGLATSAPNTQPDPQELTAVEPFPESARHEGTLLQAELDRRLADWAARVLPAELTRDEIVKAMMTIWRAMGELPESEDWWLVTKQLGARLNLLCQRLPSDDVLRSDFCPISVVASPE